MTKSGDKIKVLVINASVQERKLISDAIAQSEDLELSGISASGPLGLSKLSRVPTDVVALDMKLSNEDAPETLSRIRTAYPSLPVVLFHSPRASGDGPPSPTNLEGMKRATDALISELRSSVEAPLPVSSPVEYNLSEPSPPSEKKPKVPTPANDEREIKLVAIGSSTGGPAALGQLIPALPADFPSPIVVVQHMPPVFTGLLAERLSEQTSLEVREAKDGDDLKPGLILIAPGDHHLVVTRRGKSVELDRGPPENSCRPAVDVLFRSVAEQLGKRALGVVLTGMGKDGLLGAESMRKKGATILVQDEESSVVWGMPGFVAKAGLADSVLSISGLRDEISRLVGRRKLTDILNNSPHTLQRGNS